MRYLPAIVLGRLVRFGVRLVRPGGGSALPGLLLSKVAPGILASTFSAFRDGLVIITGSAGKSTTTKMVVAIARAHGLKVFTNPSTANIRQGFYSSILERSNLLGRVPGTIAILEMDEGHAAEFVAEIQPEVVTVLNVVEDQLDRFVDPALVREKLATVARSASRALIMNADDQNLLVIDGKDSKQTHWFGLADKALAATLGYAPTYAPELATPNSTTTVLSLDGRQVRIACHGKFAQFELPNRGLHFAVDAAAALETSQQILGSKFDIKLAEKTLAELPPVFARGEVVTVRGVPVEFILVQNPISTQLNLDNLPKGLERVMFAIGRDVHDPSWLWTVNPKNLPLVDVVTGYNVGEAELWLRHHGIAPKLATDDLELAFDQWLAMPEPTASVRTVIFSADAMRRIRRMLGFTSPDEVQR
ncbi:MAG: Mur ligase family protein [Micrococcales bacterium]